MTGVAAAPSTDALSVATPDRLSSTRPTMVWLLAVAPPDSVSTTIFGATTSADASNVLSTCAASARPIAWPSWFENS